MKNLAEKLDHHGRVSAARERLADEGRRRLRFAEVVQAWNGGTVEVNLRQGKSFVTVIAGDDCLKVPIVQFERGELSQLFDRVRQLAEGRAQEIGRLLEEGSDDEVLAAVPELRVAS